MYFDIYVNGKKRATVGHDALENVSISVSGDNDGAYLISGAVCKEDAERYHFDWLQDDLSDTDEVCIRKAESSVASEPRKRRKLGAGNRSTEADRFCDFCKLSEVEVGRLIQTGDSPAIFNRCVELCVEIIKGQES